MIRVGIDSPTLFYITFVFMKKFFLLNFVLISFISNAQILNKLEFEPFINPILLNIGNVDKNVSSINSQHCLVSFGNEVSNEFGFNLSYKTKKRFIGGIGISWWKRNYDFTVSVSQNPSNDFYRTNLSREINFNCRSIRVFIGYEFKFNSKIKLEFVRSVSTRVRHNIPFNSSFRSFSSLNGFNYELTEKFKKSYFSGAIGLNYSFSIYKNLRLQIGVNTTLKNRTTIVYTNFIEGQTTNNDPKSTFLDLQITSAPDQFFYTGVTYLIKYKK